MNSLRNFTPFILTLSLVFGISSCAQEVVDSHEHTFATDWTKNETHHWHVATCEHTSQIKDKTEHSFGEWQIMIQPTEEAGGAKERTCSICSYKAIELMPKLDHVHAKGLHHDFVAGTCITNEIVEHYDCVKETCPVKLDIDGNPLATTEGELNPENHTDTTTTWITTTTSHKEIYNCCRTIKTAESPHIEDAGTVTTAPTCVTEGIRTFKCTVCRKKIKTKSIAALGWCEYPIDATTYTNATRLSTYIYFGVFPKTVLSPNSTVQIDETINIKMGANIYYKGSDGNYYAKVQENAFNNTYEYKYSDNTQVKQFSSNSIRFFKVEPIKWKVLTNNYNGESLLLADNVLTSNVPYYNSGSNHSTHSTTRKINNTTIYENNYKYSTIRAYLNGKYESDDTPVNTDYMGKGFLQTAFTKSAQDIINNTQVENTTETTGYSEDTYATRCICENTTDKIFLLSVSELLKSDYGFSPNPDTDYSNPFNNGRVQATTDYARANYVRQVHNSLLKDYFSSWWTRSPEDSMYSDGGTAKIVHNVGSVTSWSVEDEDVGIVPALTLSLP